MFATAENWYLASIVWLLLLTGISISTFDGNFSSRPLSNCWYICVPYWLQVDSLNEHEETVRASHARVMEKLESPASSVDPQEANDFINQEKEKIKDCDVDFRDGKRRVKAAKGPKGRKTKTGDDEQASSADDEVSE